MHDGRLVGVRLFHESLIDSGEAIFYTYLCFLTYKMSSNSWSSENDEILIDFVRNHEVIYNIKSKEYRKSQLKQNTRREYLEMEHAGVKHVLLQPGQDLKISSRFIPPGPEGAARNAEKPLSCFDLFFDECF